MEVSSSHFSFQGFGTNQTDLAERLARACLKLKAAILKANQKHLPKHEVEATEEDLDGLEQQIFLLCGDGFKLTWSTEEKLRLLWTQKGLIGRTDAMACFCRRHLRMKHCPSPWQLLLHCDWLGLEDSRTGTFRYLLDHFNDAVLDKGFQKLPSAILAEFLSSPDLAIEREVDACRALLRWLHLSPFQRSSAACDLSRFVQVERISSEELMEVESVFRYLTMQSHLSDSFHRRHSRFQKWFRNLGVRVFLALTRGSLVELAELNIDWRRWETKRSIRQPYFRCEKLTGDVRDLLLVGDDSALHYKRGKASPESFDLCPEFMGPVAYRFVYGALYAIQNLGCKIKVWYCSNQNWTLLATSPQSTWLRNVQVFANQDFLVIAGRRDSPAKGRGPLKPLEGEMGTFRSEMLREQEPFLWTYHVKSKTFKVFPRFIGPEGGVQNLGATSSYFWVAHRSTGTIWTVDLVKRVWQETTFNFPVGDRVLCSTCSGRAMFTLSCNVKRGAYLTLSMLFRDPEPFLGVIGCLPFDFPKSQARDFIGAARFHVFSEKLTCF